MFSHFTKEATVERMTKTGWKSGFSDVPGTINWHMKPLWDTEQFIGLDNMANTFSFTCTLIEDIREWDRLTIDWEKYNVRGVQDHVWIRLSFTKAIIVQNKW